MILGIFCAGSLGKELYDIAERINALKNCWEEIVFIDDVREEKSFYNARVCHLDEFAENKNSVEIIIGNGTPRNRRRIYERVISDGYQLTNLIDPTAIISPTATLKKGIIITPYTSISSDVILKDNVLIQSYVRVGHDIVVNEHTVLSCNVSIGGGTVIGADTYIGESAAIRDDVTIGENTIVSMGATIYRSVGDSVVVMGNPGREIRKNLDGKIF
jgi:Acyl-[acyl carrier protein]--UDP-N-acetylglucosamine O-acyltransferase